MILIPQSEHKNLLLRRMKSDDYILLAEQFEPVDEKLGQTLCRSGEPAGHAFFPADGIFSIVAESPEGSRVEAGLLGREGFGPPSLAMGDDSSPFDGNVQMHLTGHSIATEAFQAAL